VPVDTALLVRSWRCHTQRTPAGPQLCQKSTASKAPASQATSSRIGDIISEPAGDIVRIRKEKLMAA